MLSKLKGAARRVEFDKAVFFGLSSKIWGVVAGPISALIVISHFTQALQGYYYTFYSLLALQVFAELGLGAVTQQFASHEWAKLSLDEKGMIIGDENALSRLISLFKTTFNWFSKGGIITFLGLFIGGYIFFSTGKNIDKQIAWSAPWFLLSFSTGIDIMFVPFWSILEGCNQVKNVYGFRMVQTMLLNCTIWTCILSGLGLWAICLGSIVGISSAFIFIFFKYRNFFKILLFRKSSTEQISWKRDLLPMQWRIAVSWISGYFCFSLFTPFLFKYQGPVIAGQFGLTWNIVSAVSGIGMAWMLPRVPQFAIYAAQKDYVSLDKLFFKVAKIVTGILVFLYTMAWLIVYSLPFFHVKFISHIASRIISPLPFALLLFAQLLLNSAAPFSSYLRAHKVEPLMYISVIQSLIVAILVFLLGQKFAVMGVAIGYLIAMVITIPVCIQIWYKYRKRWIAAASINQEV